MANGTTLYDEYIVTLKANGMYDAAHLIEEALPLRPTMTLTEKLQQLDKLKGWLDSFRPFPAAIVEELKKLYDVRFTYHSNAIEGNTLTQSETEMVIEKGITVGGKTLKEHLEVIGHKNAIDYVEELAKEETPITEREIKDLHNLIMRGIEPNEAGRYRTIDVRAAGTEHVYPPHFQLQELMDEFSRWLESPNAKALHPIGYASEAHYRFVAIHPFRDGNGRTGRLLMNLILLRFSFPVAVITNERRKEYIDALVYGQTNNNDTSKLTSLVADASRDSLVEYLRVLSTAAESKGKGLLFYEEMISYLSN
ncbi:MAG TPA: Fic family protein [Blastocatellia bacterium]|nr:Fic family protein [Blastocatellia bacterium]